MIGLERPIFVVAGSRNDAELVSDILESFDVSLDFGSGGKSFPFPLMMGRLGVAWMFLPFFGFFD